MMRATVSKNITAMIAFVMLGGLSTGLLAAKWSDRSATRDYYNAQAKLPWDKRLGDWTDAGGKNWGNTPYAKTAIFTQPANTQVEFDVTSLVESWAARSYQNEGFFLRGLAGGSTINFYSRESAPQANRPQLILKTNRSSYSLSPTADTYLSASTASPLGTQKVIKLGRSGHALLHFDLSKLAKNEVVYNATLVLTIQKIYSPKFLEVGVFEVVPGLVSVNDSAEVLTGIASDYPLDQGIEQHPQVFYADGFESRSWYKSWTDGGKMGEIISRDESNNFEPLSGKALRAILPERGRLALNQKYKFAANGFNEPEAAYFRYYLRLGDNWNQVVTSGKMPGFAGTYNTAGWGGRKPNGENGWSTRGLFLKTIRQGGKKVTPMGNYAYHLDQHGNYGSMWTWNKNGGALLENNRWYCIEQYVRLNTPGEKDGVLRVWLDGREVFEKEGMQYRTSKRLKIEEVWLNIYHGGMDRSLTEQTAYIDNFVVARQYIGPMVER